MGPLKSLVILVTAPVWIPVVLAANALNNKGHDSDCQCDKCHPPGIGRQCFDE